MNYEFLDEGKSAFPLRRLTPVFRAATALMALALAIIGLSRRSSTPFNKAGVLSMSSIQEDSEPDPNTRGMKVAKADPGSAFIPGLHSVLAKPRPPGPFQAMTQAARLNALFLYGPAAPSKLRQGSKEQEAWLYGARLAGEGQDLIGFATGHPEDVIKGRLLSFSASSFASKLLLADQLQGYSGHQGALQRGTVRVVLKDGKDVPAAWYYSVKSPAFSSTTISPLLSSKQFDTPLSSSSSASPPPVRTADPFVRYNQYGLRELYPEIEKPNKSGFMKVSAQHHLYWEECGSPNGKPVLFLHGGPGAGLETGYRQFFDPRMYRIVLFDQRGSGKSTPRASVEENTTWDLIKDMEQLRELLKIERWQLFGGSWGATLALTYAILHPHRVTELVLRGIFLCRPEELDFYYQQGASKFWPELWELYQSAVIEEERHNMVGAYHRLLIESQDPFEQLAAALTWTTWEMGTSCLILEEQENQQTDPAQALAFARIENHYFFNKCFLPTDNWILEQVHQIAHIPTVIVQGRYDMVCPAKSAWDLHKAMPDSDMVMVPDSGHSCFEAGICSELIKATDRFAFFSVS